MATVATVDSVPVRPAAPAEAKLWDPPTEDEIATDEEEEDEDADEEDEELDIENNDSISISVRLF